MVPRRSGRITGKKPISSPPTPRRLLFIASLHHPNELADETRAADTEHAPLFPRSMELFTWERAFRKAGYETAVFWRNLPGYGARDISRLSNDVFRMGLTPGKLITGLLQRIPPQLQPDLRRRNQLLLEQARRFKPQLIWLAGGNREILPLTLERLKREHNCKILFVHGDSPIVFSSANERAAAPLYDLALVNDLHHGAQWRELGAKRVEWLPYSSIDPELHAPQPASDAPHDTLCDIGFVGTLAPQNLYSERVAALESLRDFDLGIWSVHDVPESLKPFYRGYALGDANLQVLSSVKICINTHGDTMRYGVNLRLFECAALGVFQIVDDRPGVAQQFTVGEHLVTFSDHADLREKARYYLAHDEERGRMAAAARRHVLAHHRTDQRLARALELLGDSEGFSAGAKTGYLCDKGKLQSAQRAQRDCWGV